MRLRVLPALILLTATALVALAVSRLVEPFQLANMSDWLSYHNGAARLVLGGSPYSAMQFTPYKLDGAAWGRGFVYPPPAALLLIPTLFGTWTFWAINAGTLVFVGVCTLIALHERLPWYMCALVAAIALAQPGLTEIREGQLSPWIASAVGLMWLRRSATGWLSVLAGLVKVYPLIGLIWAYRNGVRLRGPIGLGVLSIVVMLPLWLQWVSVLANARAGCPSIALPSFTCTVGAPWLGYVATVVLVLVALRAPSDRVAFLALALAMVAPAPDLYVGYLLVAFIGLMPAIAYVLSRIDVAFAPRVTAGAPRTSDRLADALEDVSAG